MKEMFVKLLSCSRAMSMYYQHIHWVSKNSLSFQDHLLAERLYGEINGAVDSIAEKSIGVTGDPDCVNLQTNLMLIQEKIKALPMQSKENADLFKAALGLEQEFINYCTQYEKIPGVSLGFQNLLADLADAAEGRVYLLRQRLSKG